MMALPPAFSQQMQALLGPAWPAFEQTLQEPAPTSIRWNTRKGYQRSSRQEHAVPWHPAAAYLAERPVFTLDPLFHAGAYYVQEASSMLIGEAIRQLLPNGQSVRALDLCAAPGGKTTLLVDQLPADSLVLANEVIKSRYKILQENGTKWGSPNLYYSNHDSQQIRALQGFFDLVLIDAPCSGEGLFRKDPKAMAEWSPDAVQLCASRQRRILAEAAPTLAPGGLLLYCTCTYNDQENEANATWLAEEWNLEPLSLHLPEEWGIQPKSVGYQCYPHRVRGEGFYLSCFRKKQGSEFSPPRKLGFKSWQRLARKRQGILQPWLRPDHGLALFVDASDQVFGIPEQHLDDILAIDHMLHRRQLGLHLGTFKRDQFVPSHALALSTCKNTSLPTLSLDRQQALTYLQKGQLNVTQFTDGWQIATYQGQALGWLKGIKRRINNYYPKEWRIRMNIQ
jgi:16S rRNA C967 or C1407 C5-methylase (RsmB/RsmF family)/NOL1/NOP2/fmu family ribosome biogenesis protein